MEIKQSIHTTVINTSKRNCQIEVSGSNAMFSFRIGPAKRENGSIQNATEHYLYMDELDTFIDGLVMFRDKQRNSKIA